MQDRDAAPTTPEPGDDSPQYQEIPLRIAIDKDGNYVVADVETWNAMDLEDHAREAVPDEYSFQLIAAVLRVPHGVQQVTVPPLPPITARR